MSIIEEGVRNGEGMVSKVDMIFSEIRENPEIWMINGDWRGKDLVSSEQVGREDVVQVLERADDLEKLTRLERRELFADKRAVVAFYQQSTRTYGTFVVAAQDLGMNVLEIHGMEAFSSVAKGEALRDTIRAFQWMGADLIVLRHPDDDSGIEAAKFAEVPVISGGAGKLEHTTQALLDVRTIQKETEKDFGDIRVAFVGDLKYGRTVHSLSKMLATMGTREMIMVAVDELKMPRGIMDRLDMQGVSLYETNDLREVIGDVDVIYDTRVQREWFASDEDYERVRGAFQITPEVMSLARRDAILMHPFPRVDEITYEVDDDPRAVYFKQMGHGVWVRGALMSLILSK